MQSMCMQAFFVQNSSHYEILIYANDYSMILLHYLIRDLLGLLK